MSPQVQRPETLASMPVGAPMPPPAPYRYIRPLRISSPTPSMWPMCLRSGASRHLYPHHESDQRRAGKAGRRTGRRRCRVRARIGPSGFRLCGADLARAGNKIVSSTDLYGGTWNLFAHTLKDQGDERRSTDPAAPGNFRRATDDPYACLLCGDTAKSGTHGAEAKSADRADWPRGSRRRRDCKLSRLSWLTANIVAIM